MSVTIYHNSACGTSRNTLALIRNAGIEPVIVDYLTEPPDRATLADLIARAGLQVRDAVRTKEAAFGAVVAREQTDDVLLDAMLANPVLINRPFVITPAGVRLCRPSELVLDILAQAQRGAFTKEDGEQVIDADGKRVQHG